MRKGSVVPAARLTSWVGIALWVRAASWLAALTVLGAPLILRAGGDPWKDKPYQQWDSKDVHRVLFDSPWTKVIRIGGLSAGGDADQDEGNVGSRGQGVGAAQGAGSDSDEGGGNESSGTAFIVRWYSSRTVRAATYRTGILNGQMKEADADALLAKPNEEYNVLVLGTNLGAFGKLDEDALKAKTLLTTKKGKQKIAAEKVHVQRGADGKKIVAVVFSFPRKAANGEPSISADEKSVEFVCTTPAFALRASFEPPKMADKQGPDL
jgi:hypothetical protein